MTESKTYLKKYFFIFRNNQEKTKLKKNYLDFSIINIYIHNFCSEGKTTTNSHYYFQDRHNQALNLYSFNKNVSIQLKKKLFHRNIKVKLDIKELP